MYCGRRKVENWSRLQ
jgi:dTDP-4-dehydrorhamnose reductase (EC 1.1.1.133)